MSDVDPVAETSAPPADPLAAVPPGDIVARRDFWHWIKRCVAIPGLIVIVGASFLFDGYIRYPGHNRKFAELTEQADAAAARGDVKTQSQLLAQRKEVDQHGEFDLRIQRILGFALPPLGVLAYLYFSRQSRGQYRLADGVLHAPGHPPVPMDAITEIDKTKWKKKGLAYLAYQIDGGPAGEVKLDDALYEQDPIHAILAAVETAVGVAPSEEPATPTEPAHDAGV